MLTIANILMLGATLAIAGFMLGTTPAPQGGMTVEATVIQS